MAERQQDLVRRPDQQPPESLQGSEYFSRLSLGDIYGRTTLKPGTRIVSDVPNDPEGWARAEEDNFRREMSEKYGVPWILVVSTGGTMPFVELSVGMGDPMTNWAPFVAERGAIAALATSISGNDKPTVLEVGAGNGFTSRLLAADNRLRVVGIDPNLSRYEQLPDTPGDVTLRDADILNLVEEFGPVRSAQDTARIKEILEKIRGSFMQDKNMYYWGMQHGLFRGMGYGDFGKDVAELRKTAGKYKEQSPVDLVVCSFMPTGDDLTLAIRDGIRPKAIVYAMPLNGLSGVGNYYFDEDRKRDIENEVVSFNPGKEYQTVARWQTFWQDEWSGVCYQGTLGIEQADVVVQLRNDVKPRAPREIPVVRTYPFDGQLAEAIRVTRKPSEHFNSDYYRGIMGKMELLKPRVDLPYRALESGASSSS